VEKHELCTFQRMPPRDLHERTSLFAIAVVKFCRALPKSV
jgi:hypothetical protein